MSRKDLELDWRTAYSLFRKFQKLPSKFLDIKVTFSLLFKSFIEKCRIYFSKQSTEEMLNEWGQYLFPNSKKMSAYLQNFCLFLPTMLYPEEHQFGYKLWFEDFMKIWIDEPNNVDLSKLFSRLAQNASGYEY